MSAPGRRGAVLVVVAATPLLLGLPLLGVALDGREIAAYLEFPPLTRHVAHAGFSWFAFALMGGLTLAVVAALVRPLFRATAAVAAPSPPDPFPRWGWLGVALIGVGWLVAWTRVPAFAGIQVFTFLPLWFGYIVTVNALLVRRTGRSPLTDEPRVYVLLFPASAVFWWFFEYLNRFVQNWYYLGIDHFTRLEYVLWDSLAFATVLPAVYATRGLVESFPRLHAALADGATVGVTRPRGAALALLVIAAGALACIGVWPDFTFPLLWLAPLAIFVALHTLLGLPHVFSPLARGDWRGVWTWALAALVCGLFWEMWNYLSAAKWVYAVPYVQRFAIFEMPLLGYAGYLPFGLECAVAVGLARGLAGRGAVS